jgi:hypothetical protein
VDAICRLVAYGTLAPGRPNHHQLDGFEGRWMTGSIRGTLVADGWGADLGFPALILDPEDSAVEAQVFESPTCPATGHGCTSSKDPGTDASSRPFRPPTDRSTHRSAYYAASPSLAESRSIEVAAPSASE